MYYSDHYVIQWDNVHTLEDVKTILKAMAISFEPYHAGIGELGDLVKLEPKPQPAISFL